MADDNELASTRREFRQIAREEARAVYEEEVAVDADGQEWTLRGLMENFNLDRRTALQAIGLIAVGYAAPTAVLHAVSGTARADSSGQIGTNTDPLTDVITDSVDTGTLTVDGDTGVGFPATTSSASATLGGGWTQEDANRPVLVLSRLNAQTDGTSDGQITVDVDESGGTTADYSFGVTADKTLPNATDISDTLVVYLPPGAQWQLVNSSDPNNANSILANRKITL